MKPAELSFRTASRSDVPLILKFVRLIADYEHLLDEVTANEQLFEKWLFDRRLAQVTFAMVDGREIGFALYFFNFSTFTGRAGLYLEDIFVMPEHRGKGYGKALLMRLVDIARENGCGRMEWVCLDWNEPSIRFYKSLGAKPMTDWTIYRLDRRQILDLSETDAIPPREAEPFGSGRR